MINHKELRPENYIAYKGELHIVSSVSGGIFEPPIIVSFGVPISESNPTMQYLEPNEYEPIEVDKAMIIKCGLNQRVINGFFVDESEYGGMALWFCSNVEAEDMGKVELCRIKGLHHLQNLFLENTGHEVKLVK